MSSKNKKNKISEGQTTKSARGEENQRDQKEIVQTNRVEQSQEII